MEKIRQYILDNPAQWAFDRENPRLSWRKFDVRQHGYPPDKQEKATLTVLEQAEVLSDRSGWGEAVGVGI